MKFKLHMMNIILPLHSLVDYWTEHYQLELVHGLRITNEHERLALVWKVNGALL
jgi:hypothetical protein